LKNLTQIISKVPMINLLYAFEIAPIIYVCVE